ncbi:hypothetical protein L1887_21855 [Cichorium endivia]|nr:hypothetical protein L1887_21855 [Cichorium endivia]
MSKDHRLLFRAFFNPNQNSSNTGTSKSLNPNITMALSQPQDPLIIGKSKWIQKEISNETFNFGSKNCVGN